MRARYLIALAALSLPASPVFAEDAEAILEKSACNACHAVDKKIACPSFKSIAARYAGDKGAQAMLETKIRKGGAGSFGKTPMPPTPGSVSDDDIRIMVEWMLGLK